MKKSITISVVAVLLVAWVDSSVMADFSTPSDASFTYLGGNPTTWEPGANTASFNGFSTPAGPMTLGGATFSIMGAGFADDSGWDTAHGTNLTAAITALGVSTYMEADYAADISAALDVWASVSMFTNLGQVADGGVNAAALQAIGGHLGDIRVAAWELIPATTLAHGYQPGTEVEFGAGGTLGGDLHFDVGHTWVDDPFDVTGNGQFDFFTVALHELGHNLGLGHSTEFGSVMWPYYSGTLRTLQTDDIAGIQAIYGHTPVPGAALLGVIGLSFSGWLLRKSRML